MEEEKKNENMNRGKIDAKIKYLNLVPEWQGT